MIKYEATMKQIRETMDSFQNEMNSLEKRYGEDLAAIENEINKNLTRWTAEGQQEYRNSKKQAITSKYADAVAAEQKRARTVTDYNLERVRTEIDGYFSAPVSANFSARVTAIQAAGLELSNREYDLLKKDVKSYGEARLLQAMGAGRTRTESQVTLEGTTPVRNDFEVNEPYNVKVPDIEKVYQALDAFETDVQAALHFYGGKEWGLAEFLPPDANGNRVADMPAYSAMGRNYFSLNSFNNLQQTLFEANAVIPKKARKTALTEKDKRFIDALIPPKDVEKYSWLAESRVKEFCEADPDLRELFLLDERYRKFVPRNAADDEE